MVVLQFSEKRIMIFGNSMDLLGLLFREEAMQLQYLEHWEFLLHKRLLVLEANQLSHLRILVYGFTVEQLQLPMELIYLNMMDSIGRMYGEGLLSLGEPIKFLPLLFLLVKERTPLCLLTTIRMCGFSVEPFQVTFAISS